jgi:hypothetical protein
LHLASQSGHSQIVETLSRVRVLVVFLSWCLCCVVCGFVFVLCFVLVFVSVFFLFSCCGAYLVVL